jgi:hypothetical protein
MYNEQLKTPLSIMELKFSALLFKGQFLFYCFLFLPLWAHGSITAKASVSANEVGVGEAFQITVSVSQKTGKQKDLPWPKIQGDLSAFNVNKSQGSSQSSRTTIINGKIQQSTEYVTNFTFQFTPKKLGTYNIGPISYTYNDGAKPFSQNFGITRIKVIKTVDGIELKTILSDDKVYVGEQLHYTLRIIPKQDVSNITPPNVSKLIGKTFWMKQIDKEVRGKTVSIEGIPKTVYDIRFALFPLLSGNTELPSMPIEYQQIKRNARSRSIFSNIQTVQRSAFSTPRNISAIPLPPGAPNGFQGNVGEYTLSTQLDKQSVQAGDALTYKVTITGTGLPKNLLAPTLPDIPGLEIFDPEVSSNTQVTEGKQSAYIITSKTFSYVLIPSQEGQYTIPHLEFPYFDPKQNDYKTLRSDSYTVNVTPGKGIGQGNKSNSFSSKKDIEVYGDDIQHIKTQTTFSKAAPSLWYKQTWYWIILIVFFLLYIASYLYSKRTQKWNTNTHLRRQHQARSVANKRLIKAKEAMKQADPKVFYKVLLESLERFASDKLNREFRGMTREGIEKYLINTKVIEADIQSFISLLDACERGQFGGGSTDKNVWESHYTQTEELIHNLHKAL